MGKYPPEIQAQMDIVDFAVLAEMQTTEFKAAQLEQRQKDTQSAYDLGIITYKQYIAAMDELNQNSATFCDKVRYFSK